jgi:hypothetical protein
MIASAKIAAGAKQVAEKPRKVALNPIEMTLRAEARIYNKRHAARLKVVPLLQSQALVGFFRSLFSRDRRGTKSSFA